MHFLYIDCNGKSITTTTEYNNYVQVTGCHIKIQFRMYEDFLQTYGTEYCVEVKQPQVTGAFYIANCRFTKRMWFF